MKRSSNFYLAVFTAVINLSLLQDSLGVLSQTDWHAERWFADEQLVAQIALDGTVVNVQLSVVDFVQTQFLIKLTDAPQQSAFIMDAEVAGPGIRERAAGAADIRAAPDVSASGCAGRLPGRAGTADDRTVEGDHGLPCAALRRDPDFVVEV
ncbi:hypothetical protein FGB62_176g06 [Gracilaria domingensis]|nr:hypothetical protein FGB62_176g06 [Gracilaria domingensis]